MRINDPALDCAAAEDRDALLVAAVRQQIAFMRAKVPFWNERLSSANVHEDKIESLGDLSQIPILTKEDFRALRPAVLLPKESLLDLQISRWTSGTSGRPTVNIWCTGDWAALVGSTARMLSRQVPPGSTSVFNGYSQAHVTGPLYGAALRTIGAVVYDRSHQPEDLFSTAAQMDLFDLTALVLPARTTRGKAFGLSDLLAEDPNALSRRGIRWWIGSSGTFDANSRTSALEQGVSVITNLYGASEFGLLAISCASQPADFHVAQGYALVEVVDNEGVPVKSGQTGRIVVTHLSGMDGQGNAQPHAGTQILRLFGGDRATLISEPCLCGLTAPRLRDIARAGPQA